MQQDMRQRDYWEYKVAFVDFRGRISAEGQETLIGDERRTAFVRRYLDGLGAAGWELVGIQPLDQHSAYYVFKRAAGAASEAARASDAAPAAPAPAAPAPAAPAGDAPTTV